MTDNDIDVMTNSVKHIMITETRPYQQPHHCIHTFTQIHLQFLINIHATKLIFLAQFV